MRTKLLLGAATLAVGIASSMAQSNVYSVNIVGYVNVTCNPGYNTIVNQFTNNDVSIPGILGGAAAPGTLQNCQVLKFLSATGTFTDDIYDQGSGGWIDANSGNPSTNTVAPGEGFFFQNAQTTNITLTFVGQVPTQVVEKFAANAYTLGGTPSPVSIQLGTNNPAVNGQVNGTYVGDAFPAVQNMQYLTFTNSNTGAGAGFDTALIYDVGSGGWINSVSGNNQSPTPQVGRGFFIQNPDLVPHYWTNVLTVGDSSVTIH